MSQRGYYINSMSPLRADFRRDPQRVLAVLKAYSDELEAFAASLPPVAEGGDDEQIYQDD